MLFDRLTCAHCAWTLIDTPVLPPRRTRPAATLERHLAPVCDPCWSCGRALWITDTHRRTVTTLAGLVACTLQIRSCPNRACERYRCPYHPEAEGCWSSPMPSWGRVPAPRV